MVGENITLFVFLPILFSDLLGAMDVNVRNDRGWTALMLAARNGHKDVITELLEKG